jgi:xanthosine utilization system XapX-like protein
MAFFQWADNCVKKMGWIDVKLVGFAGVLIGVILVKWIPSILDINIWWFIWATVLCLVRVYYILFFKK